MLTEEVLAAESPESLERAGAANRGAFMVERLKYIGLGVLLTVFMVGLAVGLRSCESSERTHADPDDLVGQVIEAPMDTMDTLGALAMVAGTGLGLVMVVYQLGRCVVGPPKSKRDPADTIRKFYGNCLPGAGGFDGVGLDGYVCLLDAAKKEVGSLTDFKEYWAEVNKEILKEIADHFAPKVFNQTAISIESVDVAAESDRIARAKARVKMVVKRQDQGTLGPTWHELGTVYYAIEGDVGQVGDRWYVGSNEWSGEFLGSSRGG